MTMYLLPSDIASAMQLIAEAQAAEAPKAHPKAQTVTRYGITYCSLCGLALPYCPGHAPAAPPAKDGAESGLARRIKDCQGR
jgi:hypothetical protein